jgi:hypothetical protein
MLIGERCGFREGLVGGTVGMDRSGGDGKDEQCELPL